MTGVAGARTLRSAPPRARRPASGSRALESAWNLPNAITLGRVVLIVPVVALLGGGSAADRLAMTLFVLAALLDAVDGALARRLKAETFFGAFVDPLADKVMVAAVSVALVGLGRLPSAWVALALAREFYISGVRMFALRDGVEIAADRGGKLKTALQLTALALLIGGHALPLPIGSAPGVGRILFLGGLAVGLISAAGYTRRYLAEAGATGDDAHAPNEADESGERA